MGTTAHENQDYNVSVCAPLSFPDSGSCLRLIAREDWPDYQTIRPFLSPSEQARAARFRQVEDRARFGAARFWLRTLSGAFFGVPPQTLNLAHTPHGKPFWQNPPTPLHFSISHSDSYVALAFRTQGAIGVDIQCTLTRTAKKPDIPALARRWFSGQEYKALLDMPEDSCRNALFFALWSRKESVAKALGLPLHTLIRTPVLFPDDLNEGFLTHETNRLFVADHPLPNPALPYACACACTQNAI